MASIANQMVLGKLVHAKVCNKQSCWHYLSKTVILLLTWVKLRKKGLKGPFFNAYHPSLTAIPPSIRWHHILPQKTHKIGRQTHNNTNTTKKMFFRLTSVATFVFSAMHTGIPLAKAQSETYLYTIYYEESDCSFTPVALVGHSSGDDEFSVGGWDNVTNQCSLESTCLMDKLSGVCGSLVPTSSSWNRADIDNNGKIFECDETNEEIDLAVCRFLEGCNDSSKYPNCSFQLATTSDLFRNRKYLIFITFFP